MDTKSRSRLLPFGVLIAISLCDVTTLHAATPKQTLAHDVPVLLQQAKIASVSIAAIRHGRISYVAAFGEQRPGVRATPDTLYNLASLTKPITAETVLRLASEGALGLDEPMAPVWLDPEIASDPRNQKLTPRLALSHRTGFPNWRDAMHPLHFENDPGTVWGYSGEGFNYLSHFTELKLAQPFELLAKRVLLDRPHKLDISYTFRPESEVRLASPTTAAGVWLDPARPTHYNAADLAHATARAYAEFLLDVLHDRGLRADIAAERSRMQVDMFELVCAGSKAAACPSAVGFGLGWQMLRFGRETLMMHTGKDEGGFTFAYLNRTTGDGVVILTNSDNGYKAVLPVLEGLQGNAAFLRYLRSQID